jgi:dihydrofolate reductase
LRGGWDRPWNGWWGDDPPFHAPVLVLTHHARDPQPMDGGTTHYFVTDGIESVPAQARAAAGDGDVAVHGGATTINQYLAAGLISELWLHIVPLTLGAGTRLFEDAPPLKRSRRHRQRSPPAHPGGRRRRRPGARTAREQQQAGGRDRSRHRQ